VEDFGVGEGGVVGAAAVADLGLVQDVDGDAEAVGDLGERYAAHDEVSGVCASPVVRRAVAAGSGATGVMAVGAGGTGVPPGPPTPSWIA
jgi:hypothetical protein